MKNRREFFKSLTTLGVAGVVGGPSVASAAPTNPAVNGETSDRGYWLAVMEKIATPVLENLSLA